MSPSTGPRSSDELAAEIGGLMREFKTNPSHPALIGKPEGNPVQIRPAFPSADAINVRWVEGVQRNADRYVAGVQSPRANFKVAALAAKDAWKNGVNAAVQANAFEKGMGRVNEDEAIATAVAVGAAGYTAGAMVRQAKHKRIMTDVAPAMAAAVETVRRRPANTDAERETRAIEMIRASRMVGKARRS